MCLAAGVPLVESGTAGYLGQVTVHVPGKTECFDCQPKPTQKTFPVCTIRTFPEKPIHCIIWAKELLFPALFGEDGDGADINTDGGLARNDGESGKEYATRVFTEVFTTKINAVLADAAANEEGGDVWHGRSPPEPLDLSAMGGGGEVNGASGSACAALGLTDANAVWTPEQSAAVFLESTRQLLEHRTQAGAALVVSSQRIRCAGQSILMDTTI